MLLMESVSLSHTWLVSAVERVSGCGWSFESNVDVVCFTACSEGSVRLQNETYSYPNDLAVIRGRVTVCVNGSYRPICDIGWDDVDVQVLCNERYGGYRPYGKC